MNIALIAIMAAAAASMPAEVPDTAIYEREADTFLASLPDGMQDRQTVAVSRAIAGDCSQLNSTRASRNKPTPLSAGCKAADILIPSPGYSMPARVYTPSAPEALSLPVLVYYHGGGWTFGSINSCAALCDSLASTGSMIVVAVDYRLAPEHPYPAPLDDASAAFSYALAHAAEWGGDPAKVSVGGDSSGGNLALAVALKAISEETAVPASIAAIYPVTKAYATPGGSWDGYARSYGLDASLMEAFNRAYTQGDEATSRNPLVSPGDADDAWLAKMPPTLIVSASRDILLDQGRELAGRLHAAGVDVSNPVIPGAVHLFATVAGQPSAFRTAASAITTLLAR